MSRNGLYLKKVLIFYLHCSHVPGVCLSHYRLMLEMKIMMIKSVFHGYSQILTSYSTLRFKLPFPHKYFTLIGYMTPVSLVP